ncbi:MAG TPA: hypothetical protein VF516_05250 [Kofleriaceae bacterium]
MSAEWAFEAAPTMPAFPSAYPDPLTPNSKLQTCLDRAIAAGPGTSWRTPVTIVSLNPDGSRPVASFKGNEVHFSASLVKVAAMYAAFELRATLRDIAAELGTSTTKATLLKDAAAYLDPKILAKAAAIPALKGITKAHALPQYTTAFEVVPVPPSPLVPSPGFTVNFSSTFQDHLEKMIAISVNQSAAQCIHGSGYGYLNGALASAGFFDPATNNGIWLAGDYIGNYPYFRINSVNDGLVAQAVTTRRLAQMYTLLHDGTLVGGISSSEMRDLLAKAVAVPEVFINRASGLNFTVTHTKVGLGPLKPKNGVIDNVYSEASILQHTPSGRKFVAVWQNFVSGSDGFDPIGHVVRDTIDAFLKP